MLVFEAHDPVLQHDADGIRRDGPFLLDLQPGIALEARDEAPARQIDAMPPVIVAVALVEHVQGAFPQRHLARHFHIVDVGRADAVPHRRLLLRGVQHMQLDALRIAGPVGQGPAVEFAALERDRGRIQQVQQLLALLAHGPRHLLHEPCRGVGKHGVAARFVGIGQGGALEAVGAQVIVVSDMAIEAGFQRAQAGRAAQLGIRHRHQVVPVAEALAVLVGVVFLHDLIEGAARQPLH